MNWIRRLIIVILGLILILDSVFDQFRTFQFAIGLIMIGLIPIDYIIDLVTRPASNEHEIDRLQKIMKEKNEFDSSTDT